MAHVQPTNSRRRRGGFSLGALSALAILASWRVRRTWGMLLMIWIGMIAAVMLVCAVPLYVHVTTTAGLRSTINADREGSYVQVHAGVTGPTTTAIADANKQINAFPHDNLASYLDPSPQLVLQRNDIPLISPSVTGASVTISLDAYSMQQAKSHMKLIKGNLPAAKSKDLQIVVTPATAQLLHLQLGSQLTLTLHFNFLQYGDRSQQVPVIVPMTLTVVGFYTSDVTQDAFWHGRDPAPVVIPQGNSPTLIKMSGVLSRETLTSYFDTIYTQQKLIGGAALPPVVDAYWYYHLQTSKIDIGQIDDLVAKLSSWKNYIFNNFGQESPFFDQGVSLTTADITGEVIGSLRNSSTIDGYRSRLEVVNIPSAILMLELAALAIFFVTIMTALLVERQSDSIAVLRSRGATSNQVFNMLVIQGVLLTVSSLVLGPILALVIVNQLVIHVLPASQQDALNVINTSPQVSLLGLWPYAVLASVVGLLAMIMAILRAVRSDVLAMRRERARATTRPLWQRLYLDLFAAVIALAGYGISLYISAIGGNDTRTQLLIGSPLSLISPIFLVVAGTLLLLRLFPKMLEFAASLAARGRGAPALLAVGQMARSPQQALRLTMLLALACSFAIFSLVFNASQYQRILDVADYQTGADFSGFTPYGGGSDPTAQEQALMQMGSLASVSAGLASDLVVTTSNHLLPTRVEVRAVNADSFAHTAIWSAQDSSQPLNELMQQLRSQRSSSIQSNVIPAYVDATTWNALKLTTGAHFLLKDETSAHGVVTFLALGQIQRLPTADHSNSFDTSQDGPATVPGGMLVDFRTYQSVYQHQLGVSIGLNYVWLRASNTSSAIANVRAVILANKSAVYVTPLYDRSALLEQMQQDPLYLTLAGELLLGMGTALLLALLGSLLASWLSVRSRVTNFAVLRALGTSLQQLTGMLSWEQGITYGMALVLGIAFGALLIVTIVPSLVFSSVPITNTLGSSARSTNEFYSIQSALPIHMVVPLSLVIFLGVVVALCVITLTMMTRAASRPMLSKSLRLNED